MTTIQSYATFLTTNDTDNVAHNVGVTMLNCCSGLATSMQQLSDRVDDQTEKLSALNTFSATLRGYRPSTDEDDATKAASQGTSSELGTTEAESKALIAKLAYYGVVVKTADYTKQDSGKPYKVQQGVYDQWLIGLGTSGDTISADIKTLETQAQSRIEQWSKATELGADFLKTAADICHSLIADIK
ncbi:hypothetical protein [Rhizobacter sp. SG703]|uniref:hypothetical protein n=1 Tax=Rhizobacter sp. SG703 TaxID=2587140 RepID=UPI00144887D6|nr:hypothetical protein [Rhizobacter sp. SG703]NKI94069.1 hypothetical protein [Rhizobacter sp. SG703]